MTIELDIPGRGEIVLKHVVFDVNGTLAVDGVLIEGVAGRMQRLAEKLDLYMITADTHGKQRAIDAELGIAARRMSPGAERQQKVLFLNDLGRINAVAIGNGSNDVWMLEAAAIGIAVLGREGLHREALLAADVVVPSILDALDLLLYPNRLIATLRR